MKSIRNLLAVLAISAGSLFAEAKVDAAKIENPESRVEHLLEAADHLEAAGADSPSRIHP